MALPSNPSENPLPPELGVPLNAELARRGLDVEFHRFPGPHLTVVRFHAAGTITKVFVAKTLDMVELATVALNKLQRGECDG